MENEIPVSTAPSVSPMDLSVAPPAGKSWLSYVVVVIVIVVAAGGYLAYGKYYKVPDGQKLLKDAYTNGVNAKTYAIDSSIEIKGLVGPDTGTVASAIPPIVLSFKGAIDKSDLAHLKGTLDIALTADNIVGENYSLAGKLITLGEDMYFKVTKFPEALTKDPSFLSSPYAGYLNKWIHSKTNTADGVSSTGQLLLGIGQGMNQQAAEQAIKDIQAILAKANLVKVVSMDTAPDINGEKIYHISFAMDRAGVKQLVTDLASKYSQKITSQELLDLDAQLQKVDVTGEAWVGAVSKSPYKYSVVIVPHIEELKMPGLTVTIMSSLSDQNKPVSVEAPTGAVELNEITGGNGSPL